MGVVERAFSDLLRDPKQVIRDLADSDVVLRRRGTSSLRLSRADRDEERAVAFEALARLLHSLAAHWPEAMQEAALDAFSWASFLPATDRDQFLSELTRTLLGGVEFDNLASVSQLLVEWRATAEIHADPKLARRLGAPVIANGVSVPGTSFLTIDMTSGCGAGLK